MNVKLGLRMLALFVAGTVFVGCGDEAGVPDSTSLRVHGGDHSCLVHGKVRIGYTTVAFHDDSEFESSFSLARLKAGRSLSEALDEARSDYAPPDKPASVPVLDLEGSAQAIVPTLPGRYVALCSHDSASGRVSEIASVPVTLHGDRRPPQYTGEITSSFRGWHVRGLTTGTHFVKFEGGAAIDPVHNGSHDPSKRLVDASGDPAYVRVKLAPGRYSVNNGADASEGETLFTLTADGKLTQVANHGPE